MKFITPDREEVALLRADPLLWEQELDVRPEVAECVERATGIHAGKVYWRSAHDHLYALELADLGRGRPSMATVYGHWERYEPRPPEHEIDIDLLAFSVWIGEISTEIDSADVSRVAQFHGIGQGWPKESVLRTPDECFNSLPEFEQVPKYAEIEGLRMAYVESGSGEPILALHGEPTWGYLYRKMIPTLSEAGRVVVPDLIGFGRSDKPIAANAYTYRSHARWLRKFIEALDLRNITLLCQDWGGLLGLRVLAAVPDRFKRVVAMHTSFSTGEDRTEAYMRWRRVSQRMTKMDVPRLMKNTLQLKLSDPELDAYGAPFPTPAHQTAALVFPRLVPIRPDSVAAYDNRNAIAVLKTLDVPVYLPWGDMDPITAPGEAQLRSIFKNVAPRDTVPGAGHFIQEDAGPEVARRIREWIAKTPA